MSTLKTHNLQSPDAGSVNIAMTPNAGMIVAGLSTYSNQINVGSNIQLGTAGVVTATTFVGNLTGNPTGSGANLTNLPAANLTGTLPAISGANLTSLPAGLGTALGSGLLSNVFYFDKTLTVTSNTTVNPPASASTAYTHFAEVELADGVELTIEDGDALLIDVLGLDDT